MIQLRVKTTIVNGKNISKKNLDKIVAVNSELCTHVKGYGIDPKTYHEKWVIKKEDNGYIFREVTHGGGICGHHKRLRDLITRSAILGIKIFYQP